MMTLVFIISIATQLCALLTATLLLFHTPVRGFQTFQSQHKMHIEGIFMVAKRALQLKKTLAN